MDTNKIVDVVVDGIDTKDYPKFCDAYIAEAWYEKDNGEIVKMIDEELDELNEDGDFVYQKTLDQLF